jgi:urease subunit alpha
MFGGYGRAASPISFAFVSEAAVAEGTVAGYGLSKMIEPVQNCRNIGKKDMQRNDATPEIKVDPETYEVTADGQHLTCEPAEKLPLAQRYSLF